MNTRRIVLALLSLSFLLFGFLAWQNVRGQQKLLPPFDPAAVARIELEHGDDALLLVRDAADGAWEIRSAADAPVDPARIAAMLRQLSKLSGRPVGPGVAAPAGAAVEVRLIDAKGAIIAGGELRAGEARALPDGPRLKIERAPALPLWPSAWSNLQPPRIEAGQVAKVERLTHDGLVALDDSKAARVAKLLAGLSSTGFVPGTEVDWRGAAMLRVTMADGTSIDLAQVPDGEGRFFLRLASDTRADVRESRRLAFVVQEALP